MCFHFAYSPQSLRLLHDVVVNAVSGHLLHMADWG